MERDGHSFNEKNIGGIRKNILLINLTSNLLSQSSSYSLEPNALSHSYWYRKQINQKKLGSAIEYEC